MIEKHKKGKNGKEKASPAWAGSCRKHRCTVGPCYGTVGGSVAGGGSSVGGSSVGGSWVGGSTVGGSTVGGSSVGGSGVGTDDSVEVGVIRGAIKTWTPVGPGGGVDEATELEFGPATASLVLWTRSVAAMDVAVKLLRGVWIA